MRPYDEYRQFTPNPEGGARSTATLFDNHQQKNSECHELRTLTQSPLDSDHVLILNDSVYIYIHYKHIFHFYHKIRQKIYFIASIL